jgi:rhamnose transport system substrate-binding protein
MNRNIRSGIIALTVLLASLLTFAVAQDPIRIVYIPKNTGNPYFDSIIAGFEAAADELGYEFTTVAPAQAGATDQIPFVTAQIQRGVDVIAISPNSADALNRVFDRARESGIIVMIVNSDIPGSEAHRDLAILPVDFSTIGPSQVELLGSLIDYEGQVAILSATTDAPDQNVWIADMQTVMSEDPQYANMELVRIAYGDDDPQKSLIESEALLSSFTVGVAAAAQAVETAGRAPGVQVVGLGTPNQMRRFIQNGTVEAFQLWSPYNQGYLAGHLAVALVRGEVEAAPGNTFDVPGLGERSFGPDNVIITQPVPTTFDASNIDDFDF